MSPLACGIEFGPCPELSVQNALAYRDERARSVGQAALIQEMTGSSRGRSAG